MDFPLHRTSREPFPWRTAAAVAAGVAVVELVLLVVVGGALLAKPTAGADHAAATPRPARTTVAHVKASAAGTGAGKARAATAGTTEVGLPRRKVEVLVLNGNGRTGAASAAAARVGRRGYRVSAVANAPRSDYPQSIVLFRRGFAGEGQRLARDLGVHVVGPLDGIRAGALHGAHVVLILGA